MAGERASIRKRLEDQFEQCQGAQKTQGLETSRRCLRQVLRSLEAMRVSLTALTQRLKGRTKRRRVMEEGPVTPSMATPHARLVLGRTPTKLYSPFGIDSPL